MIIKFLLSLIAGTALFLFLKTLISGFLSFLIALLVYLITYKLLTLIGTLKNNPEKSPLQNNSIDETVSESLKKLRQIRSSTILIKNNESAAKIKDICSTGIEIMDHLKKNPQDLRKAKPFLNYYLVTTEKIVNRYTELCGKKDRSGEIEQAILNVESVLESINETYKKQLKNLLEDDLLDLNVEISVLEKTMKLEN